MSASAFQFFVGIDWATEAHQICLLDTQGEIVHERTVVHSGSAVGEFLNQLLELTGCPPASIAVAIEVPRGALVETLLERGFSAFFLNPKQLDRFRDRHFPAGAKDDRRDAFVLACSPRTDPHCFHAIEVDDPLVMRLRDLTRLDDELRSSFNRNSCQLREQLYRYYPQLLRLSPAANEAWLWALLELAPSPAKARRLKPARIEKLLRAHRIRRLQSADIVNELRAPGFQLAAGTADAASEHALLLIPHLRLIAQQRTELARRASKPCWSNSLPRPRTTRILTSIATSRSSSPCPGSDVSSPPRCWPRPHRLSPIETTPLFEPTAAAPRSRAAVAKRSPS